MRHFDSKSFKRLFVTQEIAWNGRYEVVVNRDGEFQMEEVDDYLPLRKRDEAPLWGLPISQPWQLIVAKVWAKLMGGYHNLKYTRPFDFIECFTPSSWRYFNIALEGRSFLSNYSQKIGKTCRILLKTKQEQEVKRCGLVSGRIIYELIEFHEFTEDGKKEYNMLIKCTAPHKWTGNLSIFDPKFKHILKQLKHKFQLESTFLINQPDFFNIFAAAYVTGSKLEFPQFIDSFRFKVMPEHRRPFFFEFSALTSGYLILTVRQACTT
jgi:hypothetical protein